MTCYFEVFGGMRRITLRPVTELRAASTPASLSQWKKHQLLSCWLFPVL